MANMRGAAKPAQQRGNGALHPGMHGIELKSGLAHSPPAAIKYNNSKTKEIALKERSSPPQCTATSFQAFLGGLMYLPNSPRHCCTCCARNFAVPPTPLAPLCPLLGLISYHE
ncbi:hypothetical protein N7513_000180 [Penicillium frequentans]|nr:hypothetical protein N7513_000180 [Penicillium glabrum]